LSGSWSHVGTATRFMVTSDGRGRCYCSGSTAPCTSLDYKGTYTTYEIPRTSSWPAESTAFYMKAVTSDYPLTEIMARYASIWAPIIPFWKNDTAFVSDSRATNGTAGDDECGVLGVYAETVQSCAEIAEKHRFAAFSFGSKNCVVRNDTCPGYDHWVKETVPQIAMHSEDVEVYAAIFEKILAYGPAVDLTAPKMENIVIATDIAIVGIKVMTFSPAMQNFTRELYNRMGHLKAATGDDYTFPCRLSTKNCSDYNCFGVTAPKCGLPVPCSVNKGIVSVATVGRSSMLQAFIVAMNLSHNLEIFASVLVVSIFLFICMSKQEREAMHMSTTELSSIVQSKGKVAQTSEVEEQGEKNPLPQ